jgi:hypothetical protein
VIQNRPVLFRGRHFEDVITPMALLVYSRPRYDSFSHSRPLYASNRPWELACQPPEKH